MHSDREHLNVIWLKRDIRLSDHEALCQAISTNKKCLIVYLFEDILLNDFHYSARHFDFIKHAVERRHNKPGIYKQVFTSNTTRYLATLPKVNKLPSHILTSYLDVLDDLSLLSNRK